MSTSKLGIIAGFIGVVSTWGGTASAQSETATEKGKIEEIVVTAEKRAESIQDLPIAISAYSGDTLAERRILDIKELSQLNPSVRVPVSDINDVRITMRGIGSFGGFEPAVALVLDGVAHASTRGGFNFNFFDVERIEVLRGPQGTIGGRNSTAGGIYITSKRPTDTVEGYLKGTLGHYDRVAVEGAIGGPIINDKLLARVAMKTDRADGWIHNTVHPGDDRMNIDTQQARASFEGVFSENLRGLLTLEYMRNRVRPGTYNCGRARPDIPSFGELNGLDCPESPTITVDTPESRDQKFYQAALRFEWDLGGNAQLTSITGYYEKRMHWTTDVDGTPQRSAYFNPPVNHSVRQESQELILTGDIGDRVDYVVGGLYQHNVLNVSFGLVFLPTITESNPLLASGTEELDGWSGYGQARYHLTDQVRLTAGVRYVHDSKSAVYRRGGAAPFAESPGAEKYDAWTPRFSVDWQPNDNLMLYTTVARGFKSGGFDQHAHPARAYNPEYVWNYEAGVKTSGWDNRLEADVTVFHMDYSNLQNRLVVFAPLQGGFAINTVNAGRSEIRGVEVNLQGRPLPPLRLSAAVAYLDARYEDLRAHDQLYPELGTFDPALGLNVRDLSGNRLMGAPEWQFTLSGDYTAPLGDKLEAVLSTAYSYNGRAYSSIFNNPGIESDSVGLIDLSLALRSTDSGWRATAFLKNLTDERYRLYVSGGPPNYWRSGFPGHPRTFGVTLDHRF